MSDVRQTQLEWTWTLAINTDPSKADGQHLDRHSIHATGQNLGWQGCGCMLRRGGQAQWLDWCVANFKKRLHSTKGGQHRDAQLV